MNFFTIAVITRCASATVADLCSTDVSSIRMCGGVWYVCVTN